MSTSTKTPEIPNGVTYHNIRGKIYRIEELEADQYEKLQRSAEKPADDGDGTVTDMLLLAKLVTLDSVTIVAKVGDPAGEKLDPIAWGKEKHPVVSRVQLEVRRAHFMAQTADEIAQEKAAAGKKDDPNS